MAAGGVVSVYKYPKMRVKQPRHRCGMIEGPYHQHTTDCLKPQGDMQSAFQVEVNNTRRTAPAPTLEDYDQQEVEDDE